MTHYEKIKRIANHYGFRHQAIKAAEECSELSAALSKLVNGEGGRAAVIDRGRHHHAGADAVSDAHRPRGAGSDDRK